jgi:hypothetical protein
MICDLVDLDLYGVINSQKKIGLCNEIVNFAIIKDSLTYL